MASGGNGERHNGAGEPSQNAGRHGHASVAMAPVPKGREDAQGVAQSPVRRPGPTQPAPSLTEDNGEEAPMETGVIGARAPSGNRGNGPQAAVGGVGGRERLAIGGNGNQDGAARATVVITEGGGPVHRISLVPVPGAAGANRKPSKKERRAEALRLRRLKDEWGLP